MILASHAGRSLGDLVQYTIGFNLQFLLLQVRNLECLAIIFKTLQFLVHGNQEDSPSTGFEPKPILKT